MFALRKPDEERFSECSEAAVLLSALLSGVMVATATEMCETEGAVWSINTVCVAIVLYVVWASSYVR